MNSKTEPDTGSQTKSEPLKNSEVKSGTETTLEAKSVTGEVCQTSAKTVITNETADATRLDSHGGKMNVSSDNLNSSECGKSTNEVNRYSGEGFPKIFNPANFESCLLSTWYSLSSGRKLP